MTRLDRLPVAVAGAGVFGLAAAVRLAHAGASVVLYDPAPLREGASAVAAGMLAPAMECALDPVAAGHFPLLRAGRDAWPALLALAGLAPSLIDRSGALLLADASRLTRARGRLDAEGAAFESLSPAEAQALSPGLVAGDTHALFSPEDWRLAPASMLGGLAAALLRLGGRIERRAILATPDGLSLDGGEPLKAEACILATGSDARGFAVLAPELARLQPIKGQILHFEGGPRSGPVVRTPQGYVAPQPGGAVAGATMEVGLDDRRTDPAALAKLRAEAERLFPDMRGVAAAGLAGVRAATPDGLPMVGRGSGDARLVLAVGARRNGWLLAPLVAEQVAATLSGVARPDLAAFEPSRFG